MTFPIVSQNQAGDLVTNSIAIANGTQNDHASVIKLVRTYQGDIEDFGLLDFKSESTGGRPTEFALLNEQQATLLLTYMRNSEIVRNFKKALVKAFYENRKQASFVALPDFTSPAAAARAWADEVEAKQAALAQLEAAKPAITFVDKYVDGTGLKTFREVCKLLQANEGRFREFLADNKVMYRLNGSWVPYQNHIDAGRLMVKTGISERNGHAFTEVKFTPKGVNWVAGEWGKHQIQSEVA